MAKDIQILKNTDGFQQDLEKETTRFGMRTVSVEKLAQIHHFENKLRLTSLAIVVENDLDVKKESRHLRKKRHWHT